MEHSDVYSKTSGSLWKYYRNKPALGNGSNINDFWSNRAIAFLLNLNKTKQDKQNAMTHKLLQ